MTKKKDRALPSKGTVLPSGPVTLVTDWSPLADAFRSRLPEIETVHALADLVEVESSAYIVDTQVSDFSIWPAPVVINAAALTKMWIFLLEDLISAPPLQSLPSGSAIFERSLESVDDVVTHIRKRLAANSDKRIERVEYLPSLRTFLVFMENGRTFPLHVDDVSADSSTIVDWRIGDNRGYFSISFESGDQLEVPWDGVLYHSDPHYAYYKENLHPVTDRARAIGERVRALRSARGLNITQLAERTGMQRPNLSRLEAGRHLPSLDTLERIADALEAPVAALVAQDGDSMPSRAPRRFDARGRLAEPRTRSRRVALGGSPQAITKSQVIQLNLESLPQWDRDPAVLAAESEPGQLRLIASAEWSQHMFRGRVEHDLFRDRLLLVVEAARGLKQSISVALKSRQSDEYFITARFAPQRGQAVTLAEGRGILPQDITQMELRLGK